MSYFKVWSIQPDLNGNGELIKVEIDIAKGFHAFNIVGMAERSVREAKDRVSSAIKNSGFEPPKQFNNKITVSLSPASIKKEGSIFDLAIAISYLATKEMIKSDIEKIIFLGELNLNGELIDTNGIFLAVIKAKELGFNKVIMPESNYLDIYAEIGIDITAVKSLEECIKYLNGDIKISNQEKYRGKEKVAPDRTLFDKIIGNELAKRALIIALAGKHHIALWGRAGSGKTMLAKSAVDILPELNKEDLLEVLKIKSLSKNKSPTEIPFVSPHHSASYTSIIGGGGNTVGAITMAHKGILFMDEFPEFDRRTIDSLRQPLEEKLIRIDRSNMHVKYPADFTLIAGMNPCKCGFYGSKNTPCRCSPQIINYYRNKLSGPIVDRISIWVEMNNIDISNALEMSKNQQHQNDLLNIRQKILSVRSKINEAILLNPESKKLILNIGNKMNLSIRGTKNLISVSKTIALLENKKEICPEHILEAFHYRKNIEI